MRSKDCESTNLTSGRDTAVRPVRWALLMVTCACVPAYDAWAGSVRLWPSAVVVEETIRLTDLCELTGFDEPTETRLSHFAVTEAPSAGGSRVIHMAMIRSALAASGTNMAKVTLSGATQCAVRRPSAVSPEPVGTQGLDVRHAPAHKGTSRVDSPVPSTLRQAVFDYFNAQLARYAGKAEIDFGHTAEQVLSLSGPTYQFRVRRRGGPPLGLVQLEVDVLADNKAVQNVPLVVRVSMVRRVAVARRSINQSATVQERDVELMPLSFLRLENLGVEDPARIIGQRAKRMISAGKLIEPAMLESVPLVTRGQLVKLTSAVGAVRVVTAGKALSDGLLGETVAVRSADRKRVELDAVVVGPGEVRIGTVPTMLHDSSIVMRELP